MKQKDLAVLIVVVFVSILLSVLAAGKLFNTPASHNQVSPVAPTIQADFNTPSSTDFNTNSIDPTQLIQIGNNTNTSPFQTKTAGN